jgi:GNAT superfamily N-acetyltransferase
VIRAIAAEDTWLLRRDVLNPNRALPTTPDPLDVLPGALHLGWLEAGLLVGVGTVSRHPLPIEPDAIAWFVRAMAVSPDWRSHGIGGRLLHGLIDHARDRDPGGIAWCHARIPAEAFYLRHGFRVLDQVDLPGKGLRLRMRRVLVPTCPRLDPADRLGNG